MSAVISLTTDFGSRDWFVGTMEAVILSIAPRAMVVGITHEIPAGDIRGGAFALAAGCRFFPKGTVHVAVVDPGVGSRRKAIAAQTEDYFFIGPDNGVLSWALAKERIKALRMPENERYFLPKVSRTFHGRDIFAPVAAHLSRGVPIQKLGPAMKNFTRLDWPEPHDRGQSIEGEVIYVDRFGNAITNIAAASLGKLGKGGEVFAGRRRRCALAAFYQAVPKGKPVAVVGSSGLLEIAINGGNAARRLGLRIGSTVRARPAAGHLA